MKQKLKGAVHTRERSFHVLPLHFGILNASTRSKELRT
jgi:hypothetical protein